MVKKNLALVALAALVLSVGACKKEEAPIGQAPAPGAPGAPGAPSIVMPQGQPSIVVPDAVKADWTAVVISVEDRVANKSEDITIPLNSDYTIPGSNLKIAVGDFLPDFKMDGITITSSSNNPNNPAVKVVVTEGDAEIFSGWLYSKFPAIHPFQHEQYGLLLKEGVKKG